MIMGWDAFQLALDDQTGDEWPTVQEVDAKPLPKAPVVDADAAFAEEREGWKG